MKCVKCGAELNENDEFCSKCGTKVNKTSEDYNQNEDQYTYERPESQEPIQANQFNYEPTNYNQNNNEYKEVNNYEQNDNGSGQKHKSSNTSDIIKICIAVVIAVGIILLFMFFGKGMFSNINKKTDQNDDKQSIDNTNTNTNTDIDNSKVNNTNVDNTNTNVTNSIDQSYDNENYNSIDNTTIGGNSTTTYEVYQNDFKFDIPEDMMYEIDYDSLNMILSELNKKWVAQIVIVPAPFQTLKQRKDTLKSSLMENLREYNPKVSDATIETLGGTEYIVAEVDEGEEKCLIAYAKLNSEYSATISLTTKNNDFNREGLKALAPVFNSAQYIGNGE